MNRMKFILADVKSHKEILPTNGKQIQFISGQKQSQIEFKLETQ